MPCVSSISPLFAHCVSHTDTHLLDILTGTVNYPHLVPYTQLPPPCSPISSGPIAAAGRSPRHSYRRACCSDGRLLNQCQPSLQLCTQPSAGNYPVSNSPRTPRHHEEAEIYRQERLDRMVRAMQASCVTMLPKGLGDFALHFAGKEDTEREPRGR